MQQTENHQQGIKFKANLINNTLNINLEAPIKENAGWIKKQDHTICFQRRTHFKQNIIDKFKIKVEKETCHGNTEEKKNGIAVLT